MFLLVFLAGPFRHSVVIGDADVETIHHCLVVGGIVLAGYLPEGVALQAQHQAGNAAVVLRIHPLAAIQRKTPEFDSRDAYPLLIYRGEDTLAWLGLQIVPVGPWRYACHLREFEDGVGSAAGIAAHHNQFLLSYSNEVSVLRSDNLLNGRT